MDCQERLRALIDKAGITQDQAAYLIAKETKRSCSVRTIRAWLADGTKPSARPCQEWGVKALEAQLARQKKRLERIGTSAYDHPRK